MEKIKIGLKGFGEIPRHLFRLFDADGRFDVVVISEYAKPEILSYLLRVETKGKFNAKTEDNFIITDNMKSRVIPGGEPGSTPWDMFDVDFVIDGTWDYRHSTDMEKHLQAGAKRVLLTSVPEDVIDRIVVRGVNENAISVQDKTISVGSGTLNAAALMIKLLDSAFGIDYAGFTAVHSYTSDQSLRDKASYDFRRSRSAAENIIPLHTVMARWLQYLFPKFENHIDGTIMNVPVPNGSMLDLTTGMKTKVSEGDVIKMMEEAVDKYPGIIQVTNDAVVSSDIINRPYSLVFDQQAMMVTPGKMLKTISWYHSAYSVALRLKEVVLAYHELDKKESTL